MRPTDLGVRIPASQTPGPGSPVVGRSGSSTSFSLPSCGFSFGGPPRFGHYRDEYKKTGYRLGPGIHRVDNTAIGVARAPNAPLYRAHSQIKEIPIEGYYMSGDLLVYEGNFVPRSKRGAGRSLKRSLF